MHSRVSQGRSFSWGCMIAPLSERHVLGCKLCDDWAVGYLGFLLRTVSSQIQSGSHVTYGPAMSCRPFEKTTGENTVIQFSFESYSFEQIQFRFESI